MTTHAKEYYLQKYFGKSLNKQAIIAFNNQQKKTTTTKTANLGEGEDSVFQSYDSIIFKRPVFKNKDTKHAKHRKVWQIQRNKINGQKPSLRKPRHQTYETKTLKQLS